MADVTTTRICNECGLAYRERLLPHQCRAEWTGRTEQAGKCAECGGPSGEGYQQHKATCSFAKQNYNPPPAPRAGERDDVAYRAVAYLVCDGIVNSDKYYPPEIARWARDLMVNEQRLGITLIREAVEQHNQHATLVEQRERLIETLRLARKMFDYIIELSQIEQARIQAEQGVRAVDEVIATIEQDAGNAGEGGRR